MNYPAFDKVTREELFALVWQKPATEVAKDLGVSDVALQKLCRRLQVPTPPRGYWAKVRAGKAPKRPNLEAFSEELDALRRAPPPGFIHLTAKQDEYLKRALEELTAASTDTSECTLVYRGIRALSPDLAAKLILLLQNRYAKWLEDLSSISAQRGAEQSISILVQKLLPRAKSQVAVFHHDETYRLEKDLYPATVIRLCPSLQQKIAYLHRVARDHSLSHVTLSLGTVEHAQFIRHIGPPDAHEPVEAELCISAHEAWIEGRIRHLWYVPHFKVEFTSERLPLQQLVPVDLLPAEDVRLPPRFAPSGSSHTRNAWRHCAKPTKFSRNSSRLQLTRNRQYQIPELPSWTVCCSDNKKADRFTKCDKHGGSLRTNMSNGSAC